MQSFIASLRLAAATLLVCVVGYGAVILGLAQLLTPDAAQGSLIRRPDGTVVGSRLLAQKFTAPGYFWPRPSAVDYNAAGAGGSNKSPTSTALTDRAQELVDLYGASVEKPLPAELAAASGGGLDPHITAHAALFQVERVAAARSLERSRVETLIRQQSFAPGGLLTRDRLINVLELNLALDELAGGPPQVPPTP
jgi:K+-transporting ATPase ATPase C chain